MSVLKLSQTKIKYIKSLRHRKKRYRQGAFILEGKKFVCEALRRCPQKIEMFVCKESEVNEVIERNLTSTPMYTADPKVFEDLSSLNNSSGYLAIVKMEQGNDPDLKGRVLVLDKIQDPGNAGSLVRAASWFGFAAVVFTEGSVDPYNSKVVQASAGTVLDYDIRIWKQDHLCAELEEHECFFLDARSPSILEQTKEFSTLENCAVFVGNEGQGLSSWDGIKTRHYLSIRGMDTSSADSLNAAMSGAIFMFCLFDPRN